MPRVTHFEIHAEDLLRAKSFYETIFGWRIERWQGPIEYYLVYTGEGPGIDGGLVQRQGQLDEDNIIAYVCTIDVPKIDEYVDRVIENGGILVVPKKGIPAAGWLVYCKDTEGNIFGMMENDPMAL